MRSLLFVPADSAKKLDKAMTSGADAIIVDLEDSIAFDGKAGARQSAAAFLKDAMASPTRPYIIVRVNGLQTGLIDADLDAIAPAKPDAASADTTARLVIITRLPAGAFSGEVAAGSP